MPVDGTAQVRVLRSLDPRNESTFAAGFDLNPNRVGLAGEEIAIFEVLGGDTLLVLTLDKTGPKYGVNLYAKDGEELRFLGRAKVKKKKTVAVGVQWTAATSSDDPDGEAILTVKSRVRASAFDLDNAGSRVGETRLGLPAGAEGTGSGAFLIDSYTSSP